MKKIIYVGDSVAESNRITWFIDKITNDLNVTIEQTTTIPSLFPKISDPLFHVDLIVISVEDFYKIEGVNVIDIVNTLSTLIKCTVGPDSKKRTSQIIAMVSDLTDPKLIKEMMSLPLVHLGLKCSSPEMYESKKLWLSQCLNGVFETPPQIREMLQVKTRAKVKCHDDFRLTPRQSQILTLIVTRGASNKVIATLLHLSESTVKLHVSCILKKCGVKNRTQLAVFGSKAADNTLV